VELVSFNGMPNLAAPVVVDSDKAIKALRWLNQEMDNRYRQFAQAGVRNIEGYNKDHSPGETLPYLVLIIDELADLMMAAFDEVERTLCRLAQLARATGIHLIVATQRPSVDVVTGLIKANFPSRISFVVTSQVDSRTILDMVGAEKLLGRGDMLYMPSEAGRPKRLQGCFISDAEIERLVYFWGNQRSVEVSSVDFDEAAESVPLSQKIASAPDPLLEEAKRLAQEHKHVSTSFLQRRLRVGYPRAARLMEALEEEGLVDKTRPKEEN
jgi:S-DNA-T family DNA segregation ATPase FtsK/SpoIIIE